MNSAADLGGTFIVLDETALAFAQIINMGEIGPWETEWIVIVKRRQRAKPVCLFTFSHALKTFTRDNVVTRFRITQDSYPD